MENVAKIKGKGEKGWAYGSQREEAFPKSREVLA